MWTFDPEKQSVESFIVILLNLLRWTEVHYAGHVHYTTNTGSVSTLILPPRSVFGAFFPQRDVFYLVTRFCLRKYRIKYRQTDSDTAPVCRYYPNTFWNIPSAGQSKTLWSAIFPMLPFHRINVGWKFGNLDPQSAWLTPPQFVHLVQVAAQFSVYGGSETTCEIEAFAAAIKMEGPGDQSHLC